MERYGVEALSFLQSLPLGQLPSVSPQGMPPVSQRTH